MFLDLNNQSKPVEPVQTGLNSSSEDVNMSLQKVVSRLRSEEERTRPEEATEERRQERPL